MIRFNSLIRVFYISMKHEYLTLIKTKLNYLQYLKVIIKHIKIIDNQMCSTKLHNVKN